MRANKMLKLIDRQSLTIVAFWSPAQMNIAIADGAAVRQCFHCGTGSLNRKTCIAPGIRHAWTYKATDKFFRRESGRSSGALTASDSRANAGMGGRRAINRARLRVGWWALIVTDPKNPLPLRIPYGAACPIPVTRQPLPRPV